MVQRLCLLISLVTFGCSDPASPPKPVDAGPDVVDAGEDRRAIDDPWPVSNGNEGYPCPPYCSETPGTGGLPQ